MKTEERLETQRAQQFWFIVWGVCEPYQLGDSIRQAKQQSLSAISPRSLSNCRQLTSTHQPDCQAAEWDMETSHEYETRVRN